MTQAGGHPRSQTPQTWGEFDQYLRDCAVWALKRLGAAADRCRKAGDEAGEVRALKALLDYQEKQMRASSREQVRSGGRRDDGRKDAREREAEREAVQRRAEGVLAGAKRGVRGVGE